MCFLVMMMMMVKIRLKSNEAVGKKKKKKDGPRGGWLLRSDEDDGIVKKLSKALSYVCMYNNNTGGMKTFDLRPPFVSVSFRMKQVSCQSYMTRVPSHTLSSFC